MFAHHIMKVRLPLERRLLLFWSNKFLAFSILHIAKNTANIMSKLLL